MEFKRVIFQDLSRSQQANADLTIRYETVPSYSVNSYDWIGLFKVGWSNHNEKVTYAWAQAKPKENGEGHVGEVIFSRSFTKEDGEYYQAVYFNKDNKLQGASSVFNFRVLQDLELVEEEISDDTDMLYITSRQNQLEMKILQIGKELTDSQERLKAVEADRAQTIEKMKMYKEKLEKARSSNEEQNAKCERICKELLESQFESASKCAHIAALEDQYKVERIELQDNLAERTDNDKRLSNDTDALKGQIDRLEEEACMVQNHLTASDNAKQQYQEEAINLRREIAELMTDQESVQQRTIEKKSCYEKELETVQKALADRADQKEMEVDSLTDKLKAMETLKVVYETEITSSSDTIKHLSTTIEQLHTEQYTCEHEFMTKMMEMEKINKKMSMENNGLLSTIGKIKHDHDNQMQEAEPSNDHVVALQLALSQMKEEIGKMDAKLKTSAEEKRKIIESEKAAARRVNRLEEEYSVLKQNHDTLVALQERKPIPEDDETGDNARDLDMLSREELRSMAQDLSSELEMKNQKKEKYKEKYLDEKQRAAAMRDYYETKLYELRKAPQSAELAAGTKIEKSLSIGAPQVEPITHEVHALPEPLVPTIVSTSSPVKENVVLDAAKAPTRYSGTNIYKYATENVSDHGTAASAPPENTPGSVGEEDNDAYEDEEMKFHDAPEEVPAEMTCNKCDYVFPTTATAADRALHTHQTHQTKPSEFSPRRRPSARLLHPTWTRQLITRPLQPRLVTAATQPDLPMAPESHSHGRQTIVPQQYGGWSPAPLVPFPSPQAIIERSVAPGPQVPVIYACPLCSIKFSSNFCSRQLFEDHVNTHFSD